MEKTYIKTLVELKQLADSLPKTRMMALAKINVLITLNMKWEKLQLNKNLDSHPFILTEELAQNAIISLREWEDIQFCDGEFNLSFNHKNLEEEHHDLFQGLWTEYDKDQYEERIKLYDFRLSINKLDKNFFAGKNVIDMGCGHGNFAHAIINAGANSVLGIDFGEKSIEYAIKMRDHLGVSKNKIDFVLSTVYKVPVIDDSFDFAIQNGVFHHLENEDAAYTEMFRLLKPDGCAWIYTEGEGSIARDLFHYSVEILHDTPSTLVNDHLQHLGFSINKRYHLGDSLKAVYKATSWEKLTEKLKKIGFKKFIRLTGGMDYDLEINEKDKWAKEKFCEGDIRLIAYK